MRSWMSELSTESLIHHLDRLDEDLDTAMINGDPNEESYDIFCTMNLFIEELTARGVKGWWSKE